ncbi:hypothetical protein GIB67_010366 [Kingdonia uniflora]|uniref:Uncharacterized protein n=1 Tax=Kingdonia uniflora TaxID=39325 RepID=A0A7J7MAD4_9MAGN|nr:hypothetical protein GIB67_010366 [Kingdonia uniflora]
MKPTMRRNSSSMKAKVMFSKYNFYRARSGKSLTKNSMSPPNLLHLSHKIINHVSFGDSHNRMGRVICFTSVATTSARVGFKCRSVLVRLHEIYLILIEETQIPPLRLGDYPGWIIKFESPHGTTWHTISSISTTSTVNLPTWYDYFAITKDMRKLTLDKTLDLEARHLHDKNRIIHLTMDLRRVEYRLS